MRPVQSLRNRFNQKQEGRNLVCFYYKVAWKPKISIWLVYYSIHVNAFWSKRERQINKSKSFLGLFCHLGCCKRVLSTFRESLSTSAKAARECPTYGLAWSTFKINYLTCVENQTIWVSNLTCSLDVLSLSSCGKCKDTATVDMCTSRRSLRLHTSLCISHKNKRTCFVSTH